MKYRPDPVTLILSPAYLLWKHHARLARMMVDRGQQGRVISRGRIAISLRHAEPETTARYDTDPKVDQ